MVNKKKTDIEKYFTDKYGESIIQRTDIDKKQFSDELYLSSGSYELNRILSGHHKYGIKRGRLIEIFGPEASGKTTLALHFLAQATKRKIKCFFIDAEHALDQYYAKHGIGIDFNYFKIFTPETCEDAFEVAFDLLTNFDFKVGVFDSVPAMRPAAELQGTMNDDQMALHARKMGKGVSKAASLFSNNNAWGIFINQLRIKVGVFFGNPETTPGGNALKYYTSYRLDIRSPRGGKVEENINKKTLEDIVDDENIEKKKNEKEKIETATITVIKTIKNKLAPPKKKISLRINYGTGIDKFDDLVRFLEYKTIIEIDKKKITYNNEQMTMQRFKKLLTEKDFKRKIKNDIIKLT